MGNTCLKAEPSSGGIKVSTRKTMVFDIPAMTDRTTRKIIRDAVQSANAGEVESIVYRNKRLALIGKMDEVVLTEAMKEKLEKAKVGDEVVLGYLKYEEESAQIPEEELLRIMDSY